MKLVDNILALIYPRRCPFCGEPISPNARTCEQCEKRLPFVTGETCPQCGRSKKFCLCRNRCFAFERCAAPFYYEDLVRKSIISFKFFGREQYAFAFASYAADTVKIAFANRHFDFVTAVPLSRTEHVKRGFNQSELFGRALAKLLRLPFRDVLVKPRDLPPQRSLPGAQRWANVLGGFETSGKLLGESVLLVDDVATTGATLNECAKMLKAAGAREVCCAVIACVGHD